MSENYFTVKSPVENVITIERSKFICNIKNVSNETEAREFIDLIRKKYSLANHNCYAYIADNKGLNQKFSDDGEPQGTAGMPMLEVLKNKKMFNTVAVVTRFFGGIKLGTGGLTRAYSGSVLQALNVANILNMQKAVRYFVTVDYDGYSKILKALNDKNVLVLNTSFDNQICIDFVIETSMTKTILDKIIDTLNGKIKIEEKESNFFAFN